MSQGAPKDAERVVREYFDRVTRRDPELAGVFHEDACLIGLGGTRSGLPAIREFYEGIIRGVGPTPSIVGDLLISGSRVAAEIEIALGDGGFAHAVDLFVVEQGRIRSLTYFVADHGTAA